ncbi:c2H2-type domain-containing protein [Caerostris darwini]|uniref:C2H2-type domain-containing protein n=1 Tax=Caerostris darwini TaxID=1538125 RepID=A0AAV4Q9P1_9ARAC|nr:c2H2-type domain-containing protein [Caerostris darwini]
MEQTEQYETVYYVTEQDIASNFLNNSDEQVIVVSEDYRIMLNGEDESAVIVQESNGNYQIVSEVIDNINADTEANSNHSIIVTEANDNNVVVVTEASENVVVVTEANNSSVVITEANDSSVDMIEAKNSSVDMTEANDSSVVVTEANTVVSTVQNTEEYSPMVCEENQASEETLQNSEQNRSILENSKVIIWNPDEDDEYLDEETAPHLCDDSSIAVNSIVNDDGSITETPKSTAVDKLTCKICFKKFTKSGNRMRHVRQVHKVKKQIGTYIKCIECNTSYKHVQKLREHLQYYHKLNMEEQVLNFSNMNAFKKWKHEMERKELTSFTLRHGARKTVTGLKYFYICHRSGKYASRVTGPRQRMLKTPGTCKLGIVCTAAIYCEENPDGVIVRYCAHHYGHGKETSIVQLSKEEQAAIQDNISKGIPFEKLLDDIRDSQSSTDHFQLYLLKKRDVRYINNAYALEEYTPNICDAESVDQWVRLCCNMEDSPILYYRQENLGGVKEDFLLIIMTEFQKQILLSASKQVVCIDSLFRRKGGRFYLTVLFIMDENEIAFPVAFCISNKVDKFVIMQFLSSIKESTGPLSFEYFMSDSENLYFESWKEVMEDDSKWLWSMWYVDNRIRVQLRVFRGNIKKRAEVYKTMRMLLECQNRNVFDSMFKKYIDGLMQDGQSKNLGNFILQKYGSNAEMWAYCYRKDIKLSTNIHLEVMHRTFRYCCREGRKKRLDKFIFVIMKLVRYKMLDRLCTMLDDEKIGLAIEAINMCHVMGLEIPSEHISSLSDKIWLVESEEEEQSVYVMKEFDTCPELCSLRCAECDICVHMYSCSCLHSMINANLCQHIHAVVWKFLTPHFSPPTSPGHAPVVELEQMDSSDVLIDSQDFFDKVLYKTHDVYKKIRGSKCNLSKDSLYALMKRLNECADICEGKKVKEPKVPVPAPPPPTPPQRNEPVYVINPYAKKDNLPPTLPTNSNYPVILPNNAKSLSQYVLLLPANMQTPASSNK